MYSIYVKNLIKALDEEALEKTTKTKNINKLKCSCLFWMTDEARNMQFNVVGDSQNKKINPKFIFFKRLILIYFLGYFPRFNYYAWTV